MAVQGTPELDTLEKHFLSEGYKLEMHNGEKHFCRRETTWLKARRPKLLLNRAATHGHGATLSAR